MPSTVQLPTPTVPMSQLKVQLVGPPAASPALTPSSTDQRTVVADVLVATNGMFVPLVTWIRKGSGNVLMPGPAPPDGLLICAVCTVRNC